MKKPKLNDISYYVASTILLNEESKYELDSDINYTLKEINNLKLLFLIEDTGMLSYCGVDDISKAYHCESLYDIVMEYYDLNDNEERLSYHTNMYIDRHFFIRKENNKYSMVSFEEIIDLLLGDLTSFMNETENVLDMVLESNGITPSDSNDMKEHILSTKISKNIIYNSTICDIDSVIIKLLNGNTTGTLCFLHSLNGISSSFDFEVVENTLIYAEPIGTYIDTYVDSCFNKTGKLILLIDIDQEVDGLGLKENYVFNIYKDVNRYIMETIEVDTYSEKFLEGFYQDELHSHYVLCDMKGGRVLTFDF